MVECKILIGVKDDIITSLQLLAFHLLKCASASRPFSHEAELKAVLCSVAVGKLMELHGEGGAGSTAKATGDDTGAKVERADGYEPPIQETV